MLPGTSARGVGSGCGEGGNLFSFAQLGCSVTGVDIAAGRIAEARKFFAERGAEGTFYRIRHFQIDGTGA